jgi:hypothetical protein
MMRKRFAPHYDEKLDRINVTPANYDYLVDAFASCSVSRVSGCWRQGFGKTYAHALDAVTQAKITAAAGAVAVVAGATAAAQLAQLTFTGQLAYNVVTLASATLGRKSHAGLSWDEPATTPPVAIKMSRHHPLRCELMYAGAEDHQFCCRPSHLVRGSSVANGIDTKWRMHIQKQPGFAAAVKAFHGAIDGLARDPAVRASFQKKDKQSGKHDDESTDDDSNDEDYIDDGDANSDEDNVEEFEEHAYDQQSESKNKTNNPT